MTINKSNPRRRRGTSKRSEESRRSTNDWETHAKDLKAGAERRADENKKAKIGDDMDDETMMVAIGDIGLNESDLKYNEAVEKFINQRSEETFGEFHDAISGDEVVKTLSLSISC